MDRHAYRHLIRELSGTLDTLATELLGAAAEPGDARSVLRVLRAVSASVDDARSAVYDALHAEPRE